MRWEIAFGCCAYDKLSISRREIILKDDNDKFKTTRKRGVSSH